jgi:hypothetical protein
MLRHANIDQLADVGLSDLRFKGLPISILAEPGHRVADNVTTLASLLMTREFPWTHFMREETSDGTSLTYSLSPHSVRVLPGERDGWHGGLIESWAGKSSCAGKEPPLLLEAGPINDELSQVAAGVLIRWGTMPPDDYWD